MTEVEVESLGSRGWFTRDMLPGATEAAAVAVDRAALFVPATTSRERHLDTTIRSDALLWIRDDDAQLSALLGAFEALRLELNEGAWLGLARFELQLARYEPGGHYVRHRDALHGQSNRRVTAIVYLNPDWRPADGGQLRLYCQPPVEIEPTLGRLVIFLSEKVDHEVLPTAATRLAATAWYYGR